MQSTKHKILLFLLLSFTTLLCAQFIVQYQNIGQQLLVNNDFSAGLSHWNVSQVDDRNIIIHNKELSLKSPATNTSVRIHQTINIPMSGKLLRLNALVRTLDIVTGKQSYKARLLLVQYFDGKIDWGLPHQVVAIEGTNDWHDVGKAFEISEGYSEFRVVVQLSHCSGEFFLKDLNLYQVKETHLYNWVKWSVRIAWLSFTIFLFIPYTKNTRLFLSKAPIIFILTAIIIGTAMPSAIKHDLKKTIDNELTEKINGIGTHVSLVRENTSQFDYLWSAIEKIDITKIAHFLLFACLIFFLRYNNPTRPVQLLTLEIFMLACATELNQLFIENRSPLFTDVIIDMAGAGAGLLLVRQFVQNNKTL